MSIGTALAKSVVHESKKSKTKSKTTDPSTGGKASASRFDVEKAKNGFVVRTHKSPRGHYEEPVTSVHKNLSSVTKHMKAACPDDMASDDGKD